MPAPSTVVIRASATAILRQRPKQLEDVTQHSDGELFLGCGLLSIVLTWHGRILGSQHGAQNASSMANDAAADVRAIPAT